MIQLPTLTYTCFFVVYLKIQVNLAISILLRIYLKYLCVSRTGVVGSHITHCICYYPGKIIHGFSYLSQKIQHKGQYTFQQTQGSNNETNLWQIYIHC